MSQLQRDVAELKAAVMQQDVTSKMGNYAKYLRGVVPQAINRAICCRQLEYAINRKQLIFG